MNTIVKCLVWDLDDTLWDGVVLEGDARAPRPERSGHCGCWTSVASCTRSRAAASTPPAFAHLAAHGVEEMFCVTQIGWEPKSAAVRRIAESLNIGLDAVAFIDNDPVERAEVESVLPQVRCYAAEDVADLPDLAEFSPAVVTRDARERRQRYRAEARRRSSEQSFAGSNAEFLRGLGLVMTVRRAREADLDRAHELTVRTHQLNTTGRTFDIGQLRELSADPTHEVLIATLRDRFGEYGAIGLAVTEVRGTDSVLLLMLMSCRVMSRGVGGALLTHLVERASARGQRCVAEFVPTEVNRVMLVTLRFAGFVVLEQGPQQVLLGHDGLTVAPHTAHVLLRSADAPTPPGDLIGGLLRRAAEFPDRCALISGGETLTYRELADRTAALAGRLVGAGVRPGDVVLCLLRQNVWTVVAMLAALRAGAAWCLVEPGRAGAQVRALVDDLTCTAVIFDEHAPPTPRGEVEALLASASTGPALVALGETSPAGPLPAPPPASAPAYVITTSGSTGAPKAVVVSRGNLAAMISGRDYPYEDGALVTLSTCPLTADAALLFGPWALTRGGTVVVPTHRELPDAMAVGALVAGSQVSHLIATPSYYRLLLPTLAETAAAPTVVALAGETLSSSLAARHRELLPGAVLMNEYGPTEATVTCVWHVVTDTASVPIGRPLPGNTARVLGPELTVTTDGDIGELYIGGDQITMGYAARPGPTATRFVADPFAGEPGARMYRTGDLARLTAAGDIDYLGRADGQVQIRGARVERHAVEAVLETHPGVAHAVTVVRTGRDEIDDLIAFIVPAAGAAPPGRRELARHCAERLSPLEVPNRFVPIDTIPIAAAGKLDTAALLARADDPPLPGPSRADWTPGQREIAELWSAALEHDDFDLDDSFFEIGGNSHRVVVLHLLLEQHRPGAVRVGQLFDLRTIRDQTAALAAGAAVPAETLVPVSTRAFEL